MTRVGRSWLREGDKGTKIGFETDLKKRRKKRREKRGKKRREKNCSYVVTLPRVEHWEVAA